ncbi:hypothetical protein D7Y13_15035 [Corallococcus praedator]|uniref:Uncharacterized protein n=1 Tax=Corallococcus praedator TaxID=2316724 RepID=A0ABX9QJR7_9BACT|nr:MULTISPECIES: DUF6232 family protein [Corallococcus]RKH31488.1 hypothetical protein D7X75_19270 [Corallococcus sp. CA031C]RKI08951.1 hypothetical protein D7Y13_15035 [Corallococcus praedator]
MPSTDETPTVDKVLFDSGGVRVTTRSVVMHGRTWSLEHVRGVTVLFRPPTNRLPRALAVLAGMLLLVDGLKQGPLAAFVRDGSPGGLALGAAALLGYAALSWRVLHSERAYIWLHTRFSSRMVYRGRASTTARALAHALREAFQQRGTGDAPEDAASGPA